MSHLADVAETLSAGQWGLLTSAGNSGYNIPTWPLDLGTNGQKVYDFSSKALYEWGDRRRVWYKGGAHTNTAQDKDNIRTICYDVASDTWSKLPLSTFEQGLTGANGGANTHQYQLETIVPRRRKMYYFQANTTTMREKDLDADDPTDITSDASSTSTGLPGASSDRGCLEWFPERQSLIYFHMSSGQLYELKEGTSSWATLGSVLTDTAGNDGVFLHYNPVEKYCFIGGGSRNGLEAVNRRWWKILANGTITELASQPTDQTVLNGSGYALGWPDPITGHHLFVTNDDPFGTPTAYRFYRYQPGTNAWDRLTSYEAAIPALGTNPTTAIPYVFDCVCVTLWDQGVTMFLGYNVYIYKHADNTRAENGLTWSEISTGPGVIGIHPLQNTSELDYFWNTNLSALNSYMVGQGYSNTSPSSAANVYTFQQADGTPSVPEIDSASPPSGMTGSLKFTVNGNSQLAAPGRYEANFDGTRGNSSTYFAPGSTLGPIFYKRYEMKLDSYMLSQTWRENNGGGSQGAYFCSISSGSGTTITLPSALPQGSETTSQYVGLKCTVDPNESIPSDSGWIPGVYTITAVPDSTHVTLDTRPHNSSASSGSGLFNFQAPSPSNTISWKTDINYGNAPDGGSSSGMEITGVNGPYGSSGAGKPQLYGQSGTDGDPTGNQTVSFVADVWKTVVRRIEIKGSANTTSSRVEAWYGGTKYRDWTNARVNWGDVDGDGFWQLNHSPYITRKDGTQVQANDAHMWQAGIIISSEPIPLEALTSGSEEEPPPSSSGLILIGQGLS